MLLNLRTLATGQYACKLVNLTELHLTLELTPKPDVLDFLKQNPDAKIPYMSWKSPSGVAFRRLPAPLPERHESRKIGGTSEDVFHDDNSPTGDDLNPTFTLTPNEAQPIGYTLCGSIRHDGVREWSQIPTNANAIPSFMTVNNFGE